MTAIRENQVYWTIAFVPESPPVGIAQTSGREKLIL